MTIEKKFQPHELASDVADLLKALSITLIATTKTTTFEAHSVCKLNGPLSATFAHHLKPLTSHGKTQNFRV